MAGARSLELPTSAISRCRLTVSDGHSRALGDLRGCQELSETVNGPTAPSDRDARFPSARKFFPDRMAAPSTAGNFSLLTDHKPTSQL